MTGYEKHGLTPTAKTTLHLSGASPDLIEVAGDFGFSDGDEALINVEQALSCLVVSDDCPETEVLGSVLEQAKEEGYSFIILA